ncbi:MAG: FtsX-like permease family protein [Pyrobaculum sp.]
MFELFKMSWQGLWERKGRTIGAIIGVVIAFTALSYALLLGETFKAYLTDYFTKNFQTNLISVSGAMFTDADVATLSMIEGVASVVPIATARGVVKTSSGSSIPVTLYGLDPSYLGFVLPRTALYKGDMLISSNFVLIGYFVSFDRTTGEEKVSVGSPASLSVGRRSQTIIASGVLSTGTIAFFDTRRAVLIDINTFRQLTGVTTYNVVLLFVDDTSKIEAISREIRANFPNVDVVSPLAVLESINNFFTSFQMFLAVVAGVSTLITALWLYDTMSINVLHRTREIGIMRSIGFRRRQILTLFLGEAFLIALIGIAIGMALLIPLSNAGPAALFGQRTSSAAAGDFGARHAFVMEMDKLVLDPVTIATTAFIVLSINLAGALLPAIRASRINIVQALRYE